MTNISSCKYLEIVHNKWLQMIKNRGNKLFDAPYDDSIHAWTQMTNYHAYLKGHASGSSPSKWELSLRVARRIGDRKKIAEAFNTFQGFEGIESRIPHLEGEKIFGSTKGKLDARDSHRP